MRETLTREGGVTRPHTNTKRAAAIATVASLVALALGAMLIAADAANPIPTSGRVPVSGLPVVIPALVFGTASAFAAVGRQPARRRVAPGARAAVVYVPGTWVLTSRWVYEHLHTIEGLELGRLLRIGSAFDIALFVAAAAMAWAYVTKTRDKRHP